MVGDITVYATADLSTRTRNRKEVKAERDAKIAAPLESQMRDANERQKAKIENASPTYRPNTRRGVRNFVR